MSLEEDFAKGEKMSDDEVAKWFTDTIATLKVLRESNPEVYERLYNEFVTDCRFLNKNKRLKDEELALASDKTNFEF